MTIRLFFIGHKSNRMAKNELIEMGEEEETIVESTSKLRDMVKGMTGFDIMKDENTFKDIYEIVLGIGKEWKNLTDLEQAGLGEALAGKRNANALYAVLNNIDTLEAAYKTAEDASGSAMREQENYAQSIQYSIDRVKASLEELAYDILNSGFLKNTVEITNTILQMLDKIIEKSNGVGAALSAGLFGFLTFNKVGMFDVGSNKGVLSSLFGMLTDAKASKLGISTEAFNLGITPQEVKLVGDFHAELQKGTQASKAWAMTVAKCSTVTQDYVRNSFSAGKSSAQIAQGLKSVESASIGARIGMTLLNTAINVGISLAISGLITLITKAIQKQNEMRESAANLADEYKETSDSLDSQKKRYKELVAEMNDSSTTEERIREIKEELASIQQDLNNKYADEYEKVNLVNGKYEEQIGILDRLSKKKAEDFIATNAKEYKNAVKYLDEIRSYSIGDNLSDVSYSDFVTFLQAASDLINVQEYSGTDGSITYSITLDANIEQADEELTKLYKEVENYGKEHNLDVSFFTDEISEYKNQIKSDSKYQQYVKIREEQVQALIASDNKLNDSYEKGLKAVSDYNEALASGEGVEKAKKNLDKIREEINNITFDDKNVKNAFNAIWEDVDTLAEKSFNLDNLFKDYDTNSTKKSIQKEISGLENTLKSEKSKFEKLGVDINKTVFGNIDLNDESRKLQWTTENIHKYGKAIESWGQNANDYLGSYSTVDASSEEFNGVEIAFTPMLKTDSGMQYLDSNTVHSYINAIMSNAKGNYSYDNIISLDAKGLEINGQHIQGLIADIGDTAIQTAEAMHYLGSTGSLLNLENELRNLKNNVQESGSTFEWYLNRLRSFNLSDVDFLDGLDSLPSQAKYVFEAFMRYLGLSEEDADLLIQKLIEIGIVAKNTGNEIEKNSPEIKLDQKSFSQSISNIKNLQTVYTNWKKQVEENPAKVAIDTTEVESLRDKFEEVVTPEVFNQFQLEVGSAQSIEQVNSAFQQLAQTYIQNAGLLDNITTANAAYVQTQLEGIGVTNANIIVQQKLQESIAEQAAEKANLIIQEQGATQTAYEEAAADELLANASDLVKQKTFELVAQQTIFNNQELSVSEKIAQLSALASAYLGVAAAESIAASGASAVTEANNIPGLTSDERANFVMQRLKSTIGDLAPSVEDLTVDFSKLGNAAKGAGSGTGKAADGANEAKDAFSDLNKEIDDLQDAYQKLKKIQDSYNKTGKISVDEAQDLMQMDFRYLAMLKMENGAISVNGQAFENLTKVKLNEMRITMMRNALNTMQSITTEAQAEAYLALCTGEANMAATEAVAIQAALEQQMRGATGAIAEAYNMIYQGLQNAMSLLGGEGFANVDFSSLAGAAENATEGVADNAIEEFEKVYDWLERRMNVLQKKADLFAAKRANADKTYYSRYSGYNYYLNREIGIKKQQKDTAKEQVKAYKEEYQKAIEGLDEQTIKAIEGQGHSIQTITDKNMSEAIDKAIEWYDKMQDAKIAIEEMQTAINDLALEKVTYLADVFELKMKKVRRLLDFSESNMGILEARGYATTPGMYQAQVPILQDLAYRQGKKLARLESKRQQMIKNGTLTKNSAQDLEIQDKIYEVQQDILDTEQKIAEAERNARDAAYERFKYTQQIADSYEEELNSINSLFYSDQAIDDEASYTKIAYGMMATQQYVYTSNIKQVEAYKQKLAELKQSYESGKIGAQEYYDEEQEIRSAMYSSAEAAKEAKDAIIELAKERIEKEIDIIEDQIKAYKELIDKQKEALDSAKDLHDYQKSIAESEKDIAKITRQLAAIENDNSYAAIATRRKLEEQLSDAKTKLEDKQYDHSVKSAKTALDKQAEAYEEAKNVEIKRLEEKLKDVDALFVEATNGLNGHMAEAMESINNTVAEYGVKMSDIISNAIIQGVQNGTSGASEFFSGVNFTGGNYTSSSEAAAASQDEANRRAAFKQAMAGTYAGELKSALNQLERKKVLSNTQVDKWLTVSAGKNYSINAISNLITAGDYETAVSRISTLISKVQEYGKKHKKTSQLKSFVKKLQNWQKKINAGYAKGVHGLDKDEIAWTQEYGDEAILSPTRNAILTPLKSGDTVLTKAQTENIYKFARNPMEYLKDLYKMNNISNNNTNTTAITLQIDNVLTVQGDVNNSNAREIAAIAEQAITKAFHDFSAKIKK